MFHVPAVKARMFFILFFQKNNFHMKRKTREILQHKIKKKAGNKNILASRVAVYAP